MKGVRSFYFESKSIPFLVAWLGIENDENEKDGEKKIISFLAVPSNIQPILNCNRSSEIK